MTVIRREKNKFNFLTIEKTCLNDKRLSWKAKSLHAYMMSMHDDWKIYLTEIAKHSTDGIESVRAGFAELLQYGYAARKAIRNKGKFVEWEITIRECPSLSQPHLIRGNEETDVVALASEPDRHLPDLAQPDLENPTLTKIKGTKINTTNKQELRMVCSEEVFNKIKLYGINRQTANLWVMNYGEQAILKKLEMMLEEIKLGVIIKSCCGWLNTALKQDWRPRAKTPAGSKSTYPIAGVDETRQYLDTMYNP